MKLTSASILCTALSFTSLPLLADSAFIQAPLHGTGLPAASGSAVATLGKSSSQLIIDLRGLTASHPYAVEVAGITEAQVTSDRRGRARVRFRTQPGQGTERLDFEPRGALLRLLDKGASVLEGVLSGAGEDRGTSAGERVELEHQGGGKNAMAKAQYKQGADGHRTFRVDLSGLDDGPLKVFVDGVERGEVQRRGRTGSAVFDSVSPGAHGHELEFEVRGAEVEIVREDHIVFSGLMQAQVPGVNVASPSVKGVALPATAAAGTGSARARLRIDERSRKHFSVEVEQVSVGTYTLLVDGVEKGVIQVAGTSASSRGEIEFAAGDDDPQELPLTFDPLGKTLSIRQGAITYFEGSFAPKIEVTGAPAPEPAAQWQEVLGSTGLDAAATGRARYRVDGQGRHKFSIEIQKVPAGTYTLTVAGVARGTFGARAGADGTVVGEIEFAVRGRSRAREVESGGHGGRGGDDGGKGGDDQGGDDQGGSTGGNGTDDPIDGHERPLNFDPRGQTIEIGSEAGIYFSHLLGTGSADAAGAPAAAFEVQAALLNRGVQGGKAKAQYRQRESGEQRFEVELEDAPSGAYDLFVGGTLRGSITVSVVAGKLRGEIEFESKPEAGHAALTFPVLGQEIILRQGATTLFSRTFPAQ